MSRILFFDAIDKMLEVITAPFAPEALHDVDPILRLALAMFLKLVEASLSLA